MNATEKAKILKENRYVSYQYQYLHFWSKVGYGIVAEDDTPARATKEAFEHYEAYFLQAADDLAGKEAYEEVKAETPSMMDTLENVFGNIADNRAKDADELTRLRAELEALKAERDWLVSNLYSRELANYQAKFGANAHQPWQYTEQPAPTAQTASEVPAALDKPAFKVGDKVRIIKAYYKSPDEYDKISAISPAGIYTLTINETDEVLADYIESRHLELYSESAVQS